MADEQGTAQNQQTQEQLEQKAHEDASALFSQLADEVDREERGEIADRAPPPPPEPTPSPSQPPAPTPAPAALSPEEIEALRALPTTLKTLGGRVAKMQSDMERAGKAAAAAVSSNDRPTDAAITAASKNRDKWNKLVEDFPEWGEAIEQRMGDASGTGVDVQAIKAQARDEALAEANRLAVAAREEELDDSHSGWRETMAAPEFAAWFKAQPQADQAKWWNTNSSIILGKMLDKFENSKQHSGHSTAPPASSAGAAQTAPAHNLAAAVTRRGGSGLPKLDASQLDGKELWDHLARQETATR